MFRIALSSALFLVMLSHSFALTANPQPKKKKPRNVIFILTDDHRFDYMGFTGKIPWLETPNMDRLAKEGAYLPNSFVTTSFVPPHEPQF